MEGDELVLGSNLRYRRHKNPDGTEGGWVGTQAHVSKNAFIGHDVWVDNDAQIKGRARILDTAHIYPHSVVEGDVVICDRTSVRQATVRGSAVISGDSDLNDWCIVEGYSYLKDMDVGSRLVISGGEWKGINTPPFGGSRLYYEYDEAGNITHLSLWTGKDEPLENAEILLKHITPEKDPRAKGTREL